MALKEFNYCYLNISLAQIGWNKVGKNQDCPSLILFGIREERENLC